MEEVILVNEQDEVIGVMEKLEAHQKGVLHRAFSVLVANHSGEILLQRRAMDKYHSPGLWTNTCCSHPRLTETLEAAAHRRLKEEMGFDCELSYSFNFIYKVAFDNGLFEHELDHVFVGTYEDIPVFNKSEVAEVGFFSPEYITKDMATNPQRYTEWFKIIWHQYLNNGL
jgi:isopentenyl-diphosphate Delta-isomerase